MKISEIRDESDKDGLRIVIDVKKGESVEVLENNLFAQTQLEQSFSLIGSCVDTIYSADEAWTSADCTKKELNDFLDQLNTKQFQEIETFFDTMPKLSYTMKVKNPKTDVESEVLLEGLASFFS